MNRRYSPSSEIAHILAEVRRMSPEEIMDTYGIEISEDKTVFDTAWEQTFKSVQMWAAFVVEQESGDYDEDEYDTGKWDDDE